MRYDVDALYRGVLDGDIGSIARSITLVESQHNRHRPLADNLVARFLSHSGKSRRIGISGVPGVGKSTFIEGFGSFLVDKGSRLAVLAVDPSSSKTGGSILGDKTRMVELSRRENAFIRPSATGGALGGVTRKTRETIIICEAAGFTDIVVETVGVGQSEVQVAEMVDCFLVLMLPTAGDELQGIKRGILELAHGILINKCDIDVSHTRQAEREYRAALHYFRADEAHFWEPKVLPCSGLRNLGFEEIDEMLESFFHEGRHKFLQESRESQQSNWFRKTLEGEILRSFLEVPRVKAQIDKSLQQLLAQECSPAKAIADVAGVLGQLSRLK